MERVRERKAVGMRRTRDILQSPGGPDRGESHEIRTQRICYRYSSSTVRAPTVIGVDDDLTTSQASITLRATNDKA